MTTTEKIPGTDEAWESGQLGQDEKSTKRIQVDADQERSLDEALGLHLISIRLPKALIEDFKLIAKLNGIGYQPLIRQVLMRFAEGEKRQIMRDMACEMESRKKEAAAVAEAAKRKKKAA